MARVDPPVQSYMGRVLKRLGVPVTPENLSFMVGWAGREGVPQSIDRYNYLGTTLPMDGSYGTNAPGVQSYPTEDAGVRAHASMLSQSNFAALRRMLASGNPYKLAGDPQVNAAMRLWSGGGYSWPLKGGSPDLGRALETYPSSGDLPIQADSPADSAPQSILGQMGGGTGVSGGISQERLQLLSGRLARGGGFGSRYPELAAQLLQRRLGGAADVRVEPPVPSGTEASGLGGALMRLPADFKPTHPTSGLEGYPAKDIFGEAGTMAGAPEGGTIVRLSGREPTDRTAPGGPYGRSLYLRGDSGRVYYLTHFGRLTVGEGQRVEPGDELGTVADYSAATGGVTPSHIHMGRR